MLQNIPEGSVEHKAVAVLRPAFVDMGFDLVRIRMMGGEQRPVLQIMADRADGSNITVDECAKLSRTASALLDVEDIISTAYELEVGSPGIDRPLSRERDFAEYIGEEVKIGLLTMQDGRRKYRGSLQSVDATGVLLKLDGEDATVAIAFSAIQDARLVLTDALIARGQKQRAAQKSVQES